MEIDANKSGAGKERKKRTPTSAPDKAVKELFEETEKEEKKFSLDRKAISRIALAITGLIVLGAGVYVFSHRTPTTTGNVDVDAVVKKIVSENQRQTQEIVNQLAKQIQQLTLAIKEQKQQKKEEKKQEQKSSYLPAFDKQKVKEKFSELEKKELLAQQKREMELQRQLLKQYVEELNRERQAPQVTLAVSVRQPKKPVVKKKTSFHRVYIPTGSIVAGRTMHVIPAPVERGVLPLPPVLVKLEGDAYTANGFSVPLDDCYAVGKAQGDWNFVGGKEYARAEIQLTKLVCVLGNGKVIEKKINAYVIDKQTGMEGLVGNLYDVSGEQIAKFTAVNTLSSFWSGLAKSYTETTTTKDGYTYEKVTKPAKYALFSSLSKSWEKFTKFYEKRLSKIYPVVLVPADRKLEVVFLSGVDLGVTDKDLEKWGI